MEREPEVLRHLRDGLVGDRPAGVADGVEEPLRDGLELGEVVVGGPHVRSQGRIRPARLLRRRRTFTMQSRDLVVEREDGPQGLVGGAARNTDGGDPERGEDRPTLCPLDGDLQGGPLARWLLAEEVVDRGADGRRDEAQRRQARLAVPVLDGRRLRRSPVHRAGEVVEREAGAQAGVTDPTPEDERVGVVRGGVTK